MSSVTNIIIQERKGEVPQVISVRRIKANTGRALERHSSSVGFSEFER